MAAQRQDQRPEMCQEARQEAAKAAALAEPWAGAYARKRLDLLSALPLLALLALVALLTALVFLLDRADAERARTKLATDALWVEQTLRFQLSVDEDMLVRQGLDRLGSTAQSLLESRARAHIAANPEVTALHWYDPQGRLVAALPSLATPADPDLARRLALIAPSTRPIYGRLRGQTITMGLRAGEGGGIVTATISLPLLVARHIPWWIAEQYAVRLRDLEGTTIAERASRAPDPRAPRHVIAFDPPVRGTDLEIAAYAAGKGRASRMIVAAIAGLALMVMAALVALYRNTARRRAAEQALQSEMAFRRSMEESLTVGLRAKDHQGRVLYVNAAFCKLVGWPREALLGRAQPMPYWAPDQIAQTLARQSQLAQGGAKPQAFETRFLRADGSEIDVQVFEAPLIDAQGVHRGWMGSVIDITAAKAAAATARAQEESLARTGRLVTLGEMASTLAHELNQPLSAIASYATGGLNLLEQGKAEPALLRGAFEKMQAQAKRAGQIIRGIQAFVKKREPRFAAVDLAEVIEESLAFLGPDARENGVRLRAECGPCPQVMADRILIQQLLINLLRNGIESMAEAAKLGGQTGERGESSGEGLLTRLTMQGQNARIEVLDRGTGIAQEVDGRLFEAFSSTKAEGMGMGLNICRSIVELHHGALEHHPRAGGGTVFTVRLPLERLYTGAEAET